MRDTCKFNYNETKLDCMIIFKTLFITESLQINSK